MDKTNSIIAKEAKRVGKRIADSAIEIAVQRWYRNLENSLNELIKERLITPNTTIKELFNIISDALK